MYHYHSSLPQLPAVQTLLLASPWGGEGRGRRRREGGRGGEERRLRSGEGREICRKSKSVRVNTPTATTLLY